MKTLVLIMMVAASLSFVRAEGPVQKAGEIAGETVDTAKNVGHSVVKGTKKAAKTVEDALTPDSDARRVDVTLSEHHIDIPTTIKSGKTAFVVKNTGKEKHSFGIQGNGADEKFFTPVAPDQTKVLHANLKRGSYTVYCPEDGHQKKGMDVQLTVR